MDILEPEIDEDFFYDHIHPHPLLWLSIVKKICDSNGIIQSSMKAFNDGVNLVACVENKWVVKIFPPFHMHQWESDHKVLQQVQTLRSVHVPIYLASGVLKNSWTYLLMTKLEGVSLESVWDKISLVNKAEIMRSIGIAMAEVHSLDIAPIGNLQPEWKQFLANQVKNCRVRHEKKGMPAFLIDELTDWVGGHLELISPRQNKVILTGEYTPFNLLVTDSGEFFKLSGMIDFGDAMIGNREYDFLGPSVFLGNSEPKLIQALFEGYGYDFREDTLKTQRTLLLLQILHRYSDFGGQLRIENWESKVKSLDDVARLIWPL